ncbi:hypothetical protein [Absidia glauca]|uniref:Ndc10 domain-containing protein n=1 Tax=Absidia glauca TaxID=4829 RepID=A0A163JM32_ABSGL|nr:hypothetical protein [Absidia glauca]
MKSNPPRQVQEWSYSSRWESIGKALSSPGIRSNKKRHINCGSSARMAGRVCANVDQIRRQDRWNNTTINGAYLTNLPKELVRSMKGFSTYGRFFYLARTALSPPTSLCKKFTGDHDAQEDFYTRLGAHDGFPPMLSHLTPFNLFWSSLFVIQKVRDILQIEAQEHDPAHTLLQQRVPMHS